MKHADIINNSDNVKVLSTSNKEEVFEEQGPFPLFDYCLVDHTGKQYSCIYDHCHLLSDCSRKRLLQKNPDFHELHFHQEDRMLWCEKVFPDLLKFIANEQIVELPDYRFIFNHRYVKEDGTISQFLHEGNLTFSEDKMVPVLSVKVFFEIADIKTEETIILTIFRHSADQGYKKVFTKEYGQGNHSPLSPRELEIISLCHNGHSSKMIAAKLKLSIHTVKNHIRNSMEKTLTHNITALVHLCLQNHWL
jgi:DNA-binding CsgD family transcriptional regulator